MPHAIALLRPQPITNRLWQVGGLVAIVVLTIVLTNQFLPTHKSVGGEMLGHDFLAFYTAGSAAADGDYAKLYNLSRSKDFQHRIGNDFDLELGKSFGPYWNPPFYAWTFAPLAAMPYPYALAAWTGLNLLCAVAAIAILARMVASSTHQWLMYETNGWKTHFVPTWRYWLLVPLLVCVSMPFIQALSHGQNTFMSLLLLAGTVALWRNQRAVLAGMVCGLLFYKPQLAAVVAVVLTISLGWRALAGITITGLSLLAIQELSMPGSTHMYLSQLPLNLAVMQVEAPYLWERHVTLKAFWRLLFQGHSAGEMSPIAIAAWVGSSVLIAFGLFAAIRNTQRTTIDDAFVGHTRHIQRDRLIAATIASMPLLMPFYFDYDLLLLSIPFTLLAAERLRWGSDATHRQDRLLIGLSGALYFWLMVNPGLARDSGVNLTVLLLMSVAALFISRACRDRVLAPAEQELPPVAHVPRPIERRLAA